jgi:hypothetical protein
MPTRKLLGAAAIAAAVAGGGIAGAFVGVPVASNAQESPNTPTTPTTPTTEDVEGTQTAPDAEDTEARGCGFGHAPGFDLDVAAEALGVSEDELREALEDGQSIADVAGERGVEVQSVIDALVAAANERIDEAVADGDLDADDAAELKEDLPDRITALVNGELPRFRRGPGGPGAGFGPGFGPGGAPDGGTFDGGEFEPGPFAAPARF